MNKPNKITIITTMSTTVAAATTATRENFINDIVAAAIRMNDVGGGVGGGGAAGAMDRFDLLTKTADAAALTAVVIDDEPEPNNCPICFEALTCVNTVPIHGCGHEFCDDCVKTLNIRSNMFDNEGLGIKVIKCPMCRGIEQVSKDKLKLKVRELNSQKNTLTFEMTNLRHEHKMMHNTLLKMSKDIRNALPKKNNFRINVNVVDAAGVITGSANVTAATAAAARAGATAGAHARSDATIAARARATDRATEASGMFMTNMWRRIGGGGIAVDAAGAAVLAEAAAVAAEAAAVAAEVAAVEAVEEAEIYRAAVAAAAPAAVARVVRVVRVAPPAAAVARVAARVAARTEIRRQRQLNELGPCCVEGCHSSYRTRGKCAGNCGRFCCYRCKKCTDCRSH